MYAFNLIFVSRLCFYDHTFDLIFPLGLTLIWESFNSDEE